MVPNSPYLEVFKNSRELVESTSRASLLFKGGQQPGGAAAGLKSRRNRMGSQIIKVPQRISTDGQADFIPNDSPFRNAPSQEHSPEFGARVIDRKSSSFKLECEVKDVEEVQVNTTTHYILRAN